MASIILKWKKYGTAKTGQTEQSGEKGLGQGVAQEPDGHSDRALEFLCGDGIIFQAHESPLGVFQKVPKDSQTMRNKILWSEETKI